MVRMAGLLPDPGRRAARGHLLPASSAASRSSRCWCVRWEHGEQQWRTGFRLEAGKSSMNDQQADTGPTCDRWVRTISKMSTYDWEDTVT